MKKNILILGCKNYPAFSSEKIISGGMEVYVWELIKYLKETYNFILVSGYSNSSDESVKVISVPLFGGFAWQPISLLIFSLFASLSLIVKRTKTDLIYAQTPLAGSIGFLFKKLFGIPYVVSVHIFASAKEHVGRFARIYGMIEGIVLSNADKVISAGYTLKEHLISEYNFKPEHIEVIHPGMDILNSDKEKYGSEFERRLVKDSSFKVLFLGRFIEENGIIDLLKAMVYLKEKKVKLLIAGNGNLEKEMHRFVNNEMLQDKVQFLGIVRGANKRILLRSVDVMVRTSYHEVFPVAYLEAISFGVPVIATPVGDTEFIADKTGAITIVPLNDPPEVARAICSEMKSGGLSPDIVSRCYKYIESISWRVQAEKTDNVFKKILLNDINRVDT